MGRIADQRTINMVHHPSGDAADPQELGEYIDTLRSDIDTLQAVTPVTAASAFGTDNRLLRSAGTGRGADASAVTCDDSGNISGVGSLAIGGSVSGVVNATLTGYVDLAEIAAPSSPAADVARVYAKESSGTKLFYKNSGGTEA